ncbi:protein kinase domain protein [Ichthyophthirius multifiliis]|uniref:Cyclin-dependent kinase 2 homolog n=1 Tax=Ichthyophthirius multifiliis TaxID=5932 RepID=G0R5Z3_ICHMU|nr:protein kinase domain protein [Ichthyophthirius multifiliis]EGR27117.1 protein kinase domain protein [Ichthyophthirius multifiliis]|eukprot:XP_004024001.1 protein kinase domain protein [Ichthyophthirius multifiliis]
MALKKIKKEQTEGFPVTALREIKILNQLNHKNIIRLYEIITKQNKIYGDQTYLVFEYCEHDLEGLLSNNIQFSIEQTKNVMFQLLQGMTEIHQKNIIHRDIKTDNILFNNQGEFKIADFGLSKINLNNKPFTQKIQCISYRSPEIIFCKNKQIFYLIKIYKEAKKYSNKVDIWSLGIIFFQLIFRNQSKKKSLFMGLDGSFQQAKQYFYLLGNPEIVWSEQSKKNLMMCKYEEIMKQIKPEEKSQFKDCLFEYLKDIKQKYIFFSIQLKKYFQLQVLILMH